jgi:hypothetical protein
MIEYAAALELLPVKAKGGPKRVDGEGFLASENLQVRESHKAVDGPLTRL